MKEFGSFLDPIFIKTLFSKDLVERRTKSYQNLITNGRLKIHLIDKNYNLIDICLYIYKILKFN